MHRVYFRISLKRGQTHCGKFQEGANPNPKGGKPIFNIGKANCQGRQINPKRGRKHPLAPPEINPDVCIGVYVFQGLYLSYYTYNIMCKLRENYTAVKGKYLSTRQHSRSHTETEQ